VAHSLILAIAMATPLLAPTHKYRRRHFGAAALAATIYLYT